MHSDNRGMVVLEIGLAGEGHPEGFWLVHHVLGFGSQVDIGIGIVEKIIVQVPDFEGWLVNSVTKLLVSLETMNLTIGAGATD